MLSQNIAVDLSMLQMHFTVFICKLNSKPSSKLAAKTNE